MQGHWAPGQGPRRLSGIRCGIREGGSVAWDRFALWRGAVYWYNKGVDLHRSGDYKKAIQCFDRALEKDPEDADAWYNKGVALYDLDRYG